VIAFFEIIAKIIQKIKTLIYVYITMLLLTVMFGFSHLTEIVMSYVLTGIMWGVGFLIVDFTFSPRQGEDGDRLPSRVMSSATSSSKRLLTVVFLSAWFIILIGFSAKLLIQSN
jgi:hypothetical protein